METVSCILCGSNQSTPAFILADYWLENLQTEATLVRCSLCGLVYQNPRPDRVEITSFYPDEYEVFQNGSKPQKGFAYRYGMSRRSNFVTRYKQAGRLLDVGCATGQFLQWIAQAGEWVVCGVEPGSNAAQAARQQGLDVVTGTLEQVRYPAASFDVVTMWDVIEHLHDPLSTLQEINRILKLDGILVLRMPNLDSIDARIFGKYWAGLDAPRHLYVFGTRTLTILLEQAGYHIVEMNSQVGGYLNFVKSVRFGLVGAGIAQTTRKFVINLLSSGPVRICLTPFFSLRDMNLRGSEVIVVAMKRSRF